MNDKYIKIGFIGCGWIVEHAHIPAFCGKCNVLIASIFDTDLNNAHRVAARWKIPNVYDNIEKMLESELDAVVIASPNATHGYYAVKALNKKISVLCEKPIALHSSEMSDIAQAAKNSNCVFVPAFVNRFRADVQMVNQIIQSKEIGIVKAINSGWIRKDGIPRPGSWFTNKKESGGGVLNDLGPHVIDVSLLFLQNRASFEFHMNSSENRLQNCEKGISWFQEERKRKSYPIDVEDTINADVKFTDNLNLNIKLSWSHDVEGDFTFFHIIGTEGEIKLNTLFGFSKDRLWKNNQLTVKNRYNEISVIPIHLTSCDPMDAFAMQADNFIQVLSGSNVDNVNINDAVASVNIIEKLYLNETRCMEAISKDDLIKLQRQEE
jgi:Predicted dehydrogenases and related proteins